MPWLWSRRWEAGPEGDDVEPECQQKGVDGELCLCCRQAFSSNDSPDGKAASSDSREIDRKEDEAALEESHPTGDAPVEEAELHAASDAEVHLTLQREGQDDLPFSCQLTEQIGTLKTRLGLPQSVQLHGEGEPLANEVTVEAAGLKSGDKLIAREEELQLVLEQEGHDDMPISCSPSETIGALKQRFQLPPTVHLYGANSEQPFNDESTAKEAELKSGDKLIAREEELQLVLEQEGHDDVPFSCSPSETIGALKQRFQLPPTVHLYGANSEQPFNDESTAKEAELKSGDKLIAREEELQLVLEQEGHDDVPFSCSPSETIGALKQRFQLPPTVHLYVANSEQPFNDESTAKEAELKSGDKLIAREEELQLVLEQEGHDDVPFSCSPSETIGALKQRIQLPPTVHLYGANSEQPFNDESTAKEAELKSGDKLIAREEELQLVLEQKGHDDVPFSCSPSETIGALKQRFQLPPTVHLYGANSEQPFNDESTAKEAELKSGDKLIAREEELQLVLEQEGHDNVPFSCSPSETIGALKQRFQLPPTVHLYGANSEQPFNDESTAKEAELKSGDKLIAREEELQLVLEQEGHDDVPFSCSPSETIGALKQRFQLPPTVHLYGANTEQPFNDECTAKEAELKSGDKLIAREEELQLVLEQEGHDDVPFSCSPSETIGALKQRFQLPPTVHLYGANTEQPFNDESTAKEAELKSGDRLVARSFDSAKQNELASGAERPHSAPSLRLVLIRTGRAPQPFEVRPEDTVEKVMSDLQLSDSAVLGSASGTIYNKTDSFSDLGLRNNDEVLALEADELERFLNGGGLTAASRNQSTPSPSVLEPSSPRSSANGEHPLSTTLDESVDKEFDEQNDDGATRPSSALKLTLIRQNQPSMSFNCSPSEELGHLKERLELPSSLRLALPSGELLDESLTIDALGLVDGDEIHGVDSSASQSQSDRLSLTSEKKAGYKSTVPTAPRETGVVNVESPIDGGDEMEEKIHLVMLRDGFPPKVVDLGSSEPLKQLIEPNELAPDSKFFNERHEQLDVCRTPSEQGLLSGHSIIVEEQQRSCSPGSSKGHTLQGSLFDPAAGAMEPKADGEADGFAKVLYEQARAEAPGACEAANGKEAVPFHFDEQEAPVTNLPGDEYEGEERMSSPFSGSEEEGRAPGDYVEEVQFAKAIPSDFALRKGRKFRGALRIGLKLPNGPSYSPSPLAWHHSHPYPWQFGLDTPLGKEWRRASRESARASTAAADMRPQGERPRKFQYPHNGNTDRVSTMQSVASTQSMPAHIWQQPSAALKTESARANSSDGLLPSPVMSGSAPLLASRAGPRLKPLDKDRKSPTLEEEPDQSAQLGVYAPSTDDPRDATPGRAAFRGHDRRPPQLAPLVQREEAMPVTRTLSSLASPTLDQTGSTPLRPQPPRSSRKQ